MAVAEAATAPDQPAQQRGGKKPDKMSNRKRKATIKNEAAEDDIQIVDVKPRKKAKNAAIDLTHDVQEAIQIAPLPQGKKMKKPQARKSKGHVEDGLPETPEVGSVSEGNGKMAHGGLTSTGSGVTDHSALLEKEVGPADEDDEKRLRRYVHLTHLQEVRRITSASFRAKPPQSYEAIKQRALTQRYGTLCSSTAISFTDMPGSQGCSSLIAGGAALTSVLLRPSRWSAPQAMSTPSKSTKHQAATALTRKRGISASTLFMS